MFRGYHMLYFENIYKLGNIVHCFQKTRQSKWRQLNYDCWKHSSVGNFASTRRPSRSQRRCLIHSSNTSRVTHHILVYKQKKSNQPNRNGFFSGSLCYKLSLIKFSKVILLSSSKFHVLEFHSQYSNLNL